MSRPASQSLFSPEPFTYQGISDPEFLRRPVGSAPAAKAAPSVEAPPPPVLPAESAPPVSLPGEVADAPEAPRPATPVQATSNPKKFFILPVSLLGGVSLLVIAAVLTQPSSPSTTVISSAAIPAPVQPVQPAPSSAMQASPANSTPSLASVPAPAAAPAKARGPSMMDDLASLGTADPAPAVAGACARTLSAGRRTSRASCAHSSIGTRSDRHSASSRAWPFNNH